MGLCLRSLNGHHRWFKQHVAMKELSREFPEMGPISKERGKVPDPWDDYLRSDWNNRSWKQHRKTQYRVKREEKPKVQRPKIVWDTYRLIPGRWRYYRESGILIKEWHCYRYRNRGLKLYRVREAYRHYRAA